MLGTCLTSIPGPSNMLDNEQDHPESDLQNSTDDNSPHIANTKKPTLRQRLAETLFRIPHRLNQSSAGYVPFVLWLLLLFGGIWFPAETVLNHVINDMDAPVGVLFGTVAEEPSTKAAQAGTDTDPPATGSDLVAASSDDKSAPTMGPTSDDTSVDEVAAAGALTKRPGESADSKTNQEQAVAESNDNPAPKSEEAMAARGTDAAARSDAIAEKSTQNTEAKKEDAASAPPKIRMTLKAAVILLVVCPLFWSWSNIALLCLMSSGMGEMNRAAEGTAVGNKTSPDYRSACTRAFFVYLFVLLNELAMVGKLQTDDGGYARIAVLASLVAFVASYRPSFYQGLISKVSTAGVSAGDNRTTPVQNDRTQTVSPPAGGNDEAKQLQPAAMPDDEFGIPSPGDQKILPASPK